MPRSAAPLNSAWPCARVPGRPIRAAYAAAVDAAASALAGDPRIVIDRLRDRMLDLAANQRFEEAAMTRDRLSTLLGAVRRHLLVEAFRAAERAEVSFGDSTWIIDRGRLLDATRTGTAGRALPIPPPDASTAEVLSREQIDEALCLARFCDKRADRLTVRCSGTWTFPIGDRVPDIATFATRAA